MKNHTKLFLSLIVALGFFLRLFHLSVNPPSLYWDEASLGYNAYSILTSGKDEHGEAFPLDRFIAFGDFKPPGYIYLTALSMTFFGVNEFAVRFPSAFSGSILVFVAYLLSVELFKKRRIGLFGAFIVSLSPWVLALSRGAFEANVAALFNLLGIYFFLLFRRHKYVLPFSVIFFMLSFYTFNSNRIIAPLILVMLSLFYIKSILKNIPIVILSAVIGVAMLMPSIRYLTDRESRVRFQEVSIFNDLKPVALSNSRIERENGSALSKLIHNRRLLFARDFAIQFSANFYPRFLFERGDQNPRLALPALGELFPMELPFILIGVWYLLNNHRKVFFIFISWMAISVIPAATAREVPHALRIVSINPSYQILAAIGIYMVLKKIYETKYVKKSFIAGLVCLYVFFSFYYLHYYYVHFPKEYSGAWQYGYKEMVAKAKMLESGYDRIFVTSSLGRPYIYFAFYNSLKNDEFLSMRVADRDWNGLWTVHKLGKYYFEFEDISKNRARDLVIATPDEVPSEFHVFDSVNDTNGKPVFLFARR